MNGNKFLYDIVRPTLKTMELWSSSSEKLLVMTACHESGGFKHRVQVRGPALSFYQIEPDTFYDVWDRYLGSRPKRKAKVAQFLPEGLSPLEALAQDDKFATAIARMKYAMVPESLPAVTNDIGLGCYAKAHWNTPLGKATAAKYLADFNRWGPDETPVEWT